MLLSDYPWLTITRAFCLPIGSALIIEPLMEDHISNDQTSGHRPVLLTTRGQRSGLQL